MQIGMGGHIQKWIILLMNMQERRNKYNAIWVSMPT